MFDELNAGAGANTGDEEKDFDGEEGEAGLPMMVWKCDGWMLEDDRLTVFCPGVPDDDCTDPD